MEYLKLRLYNLLRWSEKYTKTDMVYLTSGGFWLTMGQVLMTGANFLTSIVFAYYLPKHAYGDYKYILSVFAIFSAFTLTGLNTAIVQSVARGYEGSLRQGVRLSMRWSVIASGGALIGATYYFFRGNSFLGISLIVVAATIPFVHSYGLYASYINGKKDFKRFSLYNFVDNIIPALCTFITLLLTHNILVLLCVYFISNTVMAYVLYKKTLTQFNPPDTIDPDLVSYSKKLSLLNVISIITAHLDKVIVYTSLGSIELAIYGFASAFPDQVRSLLKNLNTLMVPKFTEQSATGRVIDIKQKSIRLAIVIIGITILYILAAPLLYQVFFPKYPESIFFSRVLGLTILSALAMIPSSLFVAQKREKELARAAVWGSVFQILIVVAGIHWGGLLGVCIARVLASYVNLGIAYYMVRHELRSVS
jgi:O-antigen/teichoic acid export membrane protein